MIVSLSRKDISCSFVTNISFRPVSWLIAPTENTCSAQFLFQFKKEDYKHLGEHLVILPVEENINQFSPGLYVQ